MLRADRRFLSTLQVSKDAKVTDGSASGSSSSQVSGQGWTPNVVSCGCVCVCARARAREVCVCACVCLFVYYEERPILPASSSVVVG